MPGGDGRFQVCRGADGVDRRLLDDDAAVNQALEIDEAEFFKIGQTIDGGHFDHPQVLAFFQYLQGAFLKIRGADHLQVICGQEFGRIPVAGSTHDHSPTKGGDAVAAVGPVVGIGQALAIGGAAGVVVLEDDRRRFDPSGI